MATARLACVAADTKTLIEHTVTSFIAEVPALEQLKLVFGLELRGRGDTQLYRVELPGPKVTKDIGADARVTVNIDRPTFNALADKGQLSDWRNAVESGHLRATGPQEILRLIVHVVERQEERGRIRKARR